MGKILTDSKRLNVAIVLLLIVSLSGLIGSLIYTILGTFMPYHVAFTGKTESNVSGYDSELMILISVFIRLMGFYGISIAVANLFVLFFGFREREKWAWFYTLIIGCIMYGAILIITYTVLGLSITYLTFVASTVLWIIALVISYKEFF